MYSVSSYGAMTADNTRMDAYARALEQSIKPNSVVVDIGSGTGILALLACRFGARHVYAIEPSDAIGVGREAALANGYADRIQWIQDLSTRVTLPERADDPERLQKDLEDLLQQLTAQGLLDVEST